MPEEPLFDHFFENFTHSVAAARELLGDAHAHGSLIEGLILYASLVDALLRNLVALETATKIPAPDNELQFHGVALNTAFFQHDDANWFNERKVYNLALEKGIINDAEYKQLNALYSFRNRVVHRFIISDIAYSDLEQPLAQYEVLFWKMYEKLAAIEQPSSRLSQEEQSATDERIKRKIDRRRHR